MDVKIHQVHFRADRKLLDHVRDKSARLSHTDESVNSVDVYLKLENNHHPVKEKVVEIRMGVPGNTLFVMHKGETFEDAFHRALDSAVEVLRRRKG
jgi:putative sigma-54 modulation protein